MARLRLWGELTPGGREDLVLHWYNLLPTIQLRTMLTESYRVAPAEAEAAAARRPAKQSGRPPRRAAELPALSRRRVRMPRSTPVQL